MNKPTGHADLIKRLRIIERIEPGCFLGEGNAMHEVARRSADALESLIVENERLHEEMETLFGDDDG